MKGTPDIALVITTFERPWHLERCLWSVAGQEGVSRRFEVVVTDDGSRDGTAHLVHEIAATVDFPLRFVTRFHGGFQLAACRNAGVRSTTAPYLLFLDGDCVLPRDHLCIHLEQRRVGVVNGSDCLRLGREASLAVDPPTAAGQGYQGSVPWGEHWRLQREHWDARLNWLLRHPHKPKLFGNNIGLWRQDLERINGFDERFQGWGGEDDDLRLRLVAAGLRICSLRHLTHTWHLWHPPDPSAPVRYRDGVNVPRVQRRFRLIRCLQGLRQRDSHDLDVRVLNPESWPWKRDKMPGRQVQEGPVELEVLTLPGPCRRFSGEAQCNVLVLLPGASRPPLRQAHVVVGAPEGAGFEPCLPLGPVPLGGLWQLL